MCIRDRHYPTELLPTRKHQELSFGSVLISLIIVSSNLDARAILYCLWQMEINVNNKNHKLKKHRAQSASRLAKGLRKNKMRIALWSLTIVGLLLLSLMPSISSALSLSDQDKFDHIWSLAEDVGAYEFETDMLQTTLPSLSLENLGQTPQRLKATAIGSVNSIDELLTFDLDAPQGSLEIRVEDGAAYGREYFGPDTPWVKMESAPQLFAPGNDMQGYAAAAVDVVKVENWRETESLDVVTQLHVEDATGMFTLSLIHI